MVEKRAFYRLYYPVHDRPVWEIDGREYEVMEISERGARLRYGEGLPERLAEPVSGMIHFSDGSDVQVEGSILRKIPNGVVVELSKGISFRRMLVEQVHLKERYPRYFDRPDPPPGAAPGAGDADN